MADDHIFDLQLAQQTVIASNTQNNQRQIFTPPFPISAIQGWIKKSFVYKNPTRQEFYQDRQVYSFSHLIDRISDDRR